MYLWDVPDQNLQALKKCQQQLMSRMNKLPIDPLRWLPVELVEMTFQYMPFRTQWQVV